MFGCVDVCGCERLGVRVLGLVTISVCRWLKGPMCTGALIHTRTEAELQGLCFLLYLKECKGAEEPGRWF